MARVGQGVARGAEVIPWLQLEQVHPLGEAQGVAHRVASGLIGGVGRVDAADDAEVHQDRVVAQEHVPGLAEVTVLIRQAGRVVPIAMRLDGAKGRWELVELEY